MKEFNPEDYGATPVDDFDPTAFGATNDHQGALDFINSGVAPGFRGPAPSTSIGKNLSNSNPLVGGVNDFYNNSIKNPAVGLASPFLKVAGSGVRSLQSLPSLLRGNVAESDAIRAKPIFGQKTLEGSSNLQNVGTALEAGSNLFGFGTAGSATKGAFVPAVKAGFKQGVTQGAGSYLANTENPTLTGTLGATAKGGILGAGGAGFAAKIQPVITGEQSLSSFAKSNLTPSGVKGQLQSKVVNGLKASYNDLFTGTKSATKTFNKSARIGKDPSTLLAENGYVVDTTKSNGRYAIDAQPTIQKIMTEQVAPLEQTLDQLLAAKDAQLPESEYINLDRLGEMAKQKAITSQTKGSGNLPKINTEIDNTIANLKSTYGDKVNFGQLNEIKKGQWSQVGTFDPTSPKYMGDVNRAIGQSAKVTIEKNVSEAPIKNLNAKVGDWYDAVGNLRDVNGNVVKDGKIGSYTNRVIGTIVGSHFGPLGALAGDLGAGFVSDLVQSTTFSNPIKQSILESIPKDSTIYKEAQSALTQLKYGQKLLPASSGGAKVQNNVPINLPARFRPLETGTRARVETNPARMLPPRTNPAYDPNTIRLPAKSDSTLQANENRSAQTAPRSIFIRPKGTSQSKPVTQIFGGKSNIKGRFNK